MSGGIVRAGELPYNPWRCLTELSVCENCKFTYRRWSDGPHACPNCDPAQPTPFALRITNPNDFLGPDWVWVEHRGRRGGWCLKGEFVLVDRASFDNALQILEPFKDDFEPGRDLVVQLAELFAAAKTEAR